MQNAVRKITVVVVFSAMLLPVVGYAQGRVGAAEEAQRSLQKADSLVAEGSVEEAEELYKAAIKLDPSQVVAFERYSLLLFALGRYAEGLKIADDGLRYAADNHALKAVRGLHLFKLNRLQEAYKILLVESKELPERFEIQALTSQVCARVEDNACVIEVVQRYFQHRPEQDAIKDVPYRTALGVALLKSGQFSKAENALSEVIRVKPDHLPARISMAEVLLKLGRFSQALAAYEKLLAENSDPLLRLKMGQALLGVRRYRDALKQAEAYCASLGGKLNTDCLLLRGDAAAELKLYARALADYRQAERLTRDVAPIRMRIAQLLFDTQKFNDALKELAGFVDQPQAEPAMLALAIRAAIRVQQRERAVRLAIRLADKPDATADHFYYAGMAHASSGLFAEAMRFFDKALKLAPKHVGIVRESTKVLTHMAARALKAQNIEDAVNALRRASAIDPMSLMTARNLATVYMKQGHYEAALTQIRIVLKKTPQDYVANRIAGRALAQLGRYQEAQLHFEQAIGAVLRVGGVALAHALAESSVVQLKLGLVERAVIELERALELAKSRQDGAQLIPDIQKNLARAHVLRAAKGKSGADAGKDLWPGLQRAMELSKDLPEAERNVVTLAFLLVGLSQGKTAEVAPLLKKLPPGIESGLTTPFDKLGGKLISAYAEAMTGDSRVKMKAAAKLTTLADAAGGRAKTVITKLVQATYEQVAADSYNAGRTAPALAAMQKLRPLISNPSPQQKQNFAVVDYNSGKREDGLTALTALSGQVAMAQCNLAVHYESAGDMTKAYEHYRQCAARGAAFPGLKVLLDAQKRVMEVLQ